MTKRQRRAAAALKGLSPESRRFWLKAYPEGLDSNLVGAILAFEKDLDAETQRWKAGLIQIFKKSPKKRPRTRTTRTARR